MPGWFCRPTRRAVVFGIALALTVGACSKPYDGVSDADRELQAKQAALDAAAQQGFKMTEKTYPLGKAWVVDMKGATVTDDTLRKLKGAGHVAELDLSRSTVTDAHLALIRELGIGTTLFRLDLSHTGVTDAGLGHLEGLPFLVNINASGTAITAAGVDHYKSARANNPQVNAQFRNATITR
ncbi:hypothetical protein [Frigoriglobus tundricola]|uniref:Leucine Rich repeats (2 copies) n=1 Tax=Frigoriglobus tundricola TaxID=2774151 RepID=A0A6M5YN98_9BACT|nr:hypothetical protein [Frigoriglobus tundricola]QJW95527.1 hypothetical protein FTUN_3076 [Frigoriglobus tundricola]